MRAVELVLAAGWAALWLYWLVAAFPVKKGRIPWSRQFRIRATVRTVCGGGCIAWGGLRRDRLSGYLHDQLRQPLGTVLPKSRRL